MHDDCVTDGGPVTQEYSLNSIPYSLQRIGIASPGNHKIGKKQAITRNRGKRRIPPNLANSCTIIRGGIAAASRMASRPSPRTFWGQVITVLLEGTLAKKWHAVAEKCVAAVFWRTLSGLVRSKGISLRDWDQRPCSETVIRGLYQGIAVNTASTGTVNRHDPWE